MIWRRLSNAAKAEAFEADPRWNDIGVRGSGWENEPRELRDPARHCRKLNALLFQNAELSVAFLHLLTGIGSYLTAPLWLIFLVFGILVSLQAQFVRPEYFPKGFSLSPTT
jgi:membrane glycosyltransferase